MRRLAISILLMALALSGCQVAQITIPDTGQFFHIKEGKHRATLGILNTPYVAAPVFGDLDTFYVRFNFGDVWYPRPSDNPDWDDVNKIGGISYGFNHHDHSARFGWVNDYQDSARIKVYAYTYDDGTFSYRYLETVPQGFTQDAAIIATDTSVTYVLHPGTIRELKYTVRGTFPVDAGKGWILGPYHGGNLPAPKDLRLGVVVSRKKAFTWIVRHDN